MQVRSNNWLSLARLAADEATPQPTSNKGAIAVAILAGAAFLIAFLDWKSS